MCIFMFLMRCTIYIGIILIIYHFLDIWTANENLYSSTFVLLFIMRHMFL